MYKKHRKKHKKNSKSRKKNKETKCFLGDGRPMEVDEELVDVVNRTLAENLIKFAWCYDTNEERAVAIKKFVEENADGGFNYEDRPERIAGVPEIVEEALDVYGIEEVLKNAVYHGVYNTIDDEDYVGSYFSFSMHIQSLDMNATIIANDLIDFWIVANDDSIVIFPHHSDKVNQALRDHFDNFKDSVDSISIAPFVA